MSSIALRTIPAGLRARSPEGLLDLILRDLGNPFAVELDTIGKRRLASVLVEMYRQKRTAKGIQNAIRFFLGIDMKFAGSGRSSNKKIDIAIFEPGSEHTPENVHRLVICQKGLKLGDRSSRRRP